MKLRNSKKTSGMSLLELMIALTVLVVGLLALMALILTAVATNSRNRTDTSGTFVSQTFLEAILTQPGGGAVTLIDCAGNAVAIQTAAPAAVNTSNGATLMTDGSGRIDFSQAAAGIAAGYHANYVGCGSGGKNMTFDVRWNVYRINSYSRQVTVAARQTPIGGTGALAGVYFQMPANLRSILTVY